MSVFISHAVADKPLVSAFVDLLQTGAGVPHEEIFCVCLEGLGVPKGTNFVQFVKDKLMNVKIVIPVLTPKFYDSHFCLCELGATWVLDDKQFCPILVPPLTYNDLKAILMGVQAGVMDKAADLSLLRDLLLELEIGSGKTARWEVKRDEFLQRFPDLQKQLLPADRVALEKYQEAEAKYKEALQSLAERNDQIAALNRQIDDLKKCKDAREVIEVSRKYDSVADQFDELVGKYARLTKGLPGVVREALFYTWNSINWNPEQDERLADAFERDYIVFSDGYEANTEHPKVQRAWGALEELSRFLSDDGSVDFLAELEEEVDFPPSLTNRDFWREYLDL